MSATCAGRWPRVFKGEERSKLLEQQMLETVAQEPVSVQVDTQ